MKRRALFAALAGLPFIGRLAAKPKLAEGSEILKSFDARDWARHFVAHVKAIPGLATDEGTMTGWFANALMRGYDEATSRAAREAGQRGLRIIFASSWLTSTGLGVSTFDSEAAMKVVAKHLPGRVLYETTDGRRILNRLGLDGEWIPGYEVVLYPEGGTFPHDGNASQFDVLFVEWIKQRQAPIECGPMSAASYSATA